MLFRSKIYLKNVRFHAYHGVLPQETQVGNDYVVNLDGECELPDACQQELQSAQATYHFTVTGILLDEGQTAMDFSLEPFCQKIYRTSELTDNAVVQSVIGLLV